MSKEWDGMALKPVRFPVEEKGPIETYLETTTVNTDAREETK